ncbi:hypothetical protein IWC76_RS27140, partial [Escherichia coli]
MIMNKIKKILKFCTLKKYDTSSALGREQERYRIISLSVISSLI